MYEHNRLPRHPVLFLREGYPGPRVMSYNEGEKGV